VARPLAKSCASIARLQHLTLAAMFVAVLPGAATAGAWVPAPGTTQTILTIAVTQDTLGRADTGAELYGERGLSSGWALVLEPSMGELGAQPVGQERLTALRRSLYSGHGWAVSAQAGVVDGPTNDGRRGSSFVGTEARLMVGKGFNNGIWFDAGAGSRSCGAGSALRWEAALGRTDSACGRSRTRTQISYVFAMTERIGIEFGWRATVDSPDGWGGQGAVIGLWRRY
jgi:hypothetical protein